MSSTSRHGGKRKGAGRKPAPIPVFMKRLRAWPNEKAEFITLLTGDARRDFVILVNALKRWRGKE